MTNKKGCNIGGVTINHLMYADDLALMCPSVRGLRELISICESYGIDHDIMYHPKKSKCMYFIPRKSPLKIDYLPRVSLDGKTLEVAHRHSYLGYAMSDNCFDDEAIKSQMRRFYIRANTLLRKFPLCSTHVKLYLFRSFCTNMYCSQLWSLYSNKSLNDLRVAYNNAFRIIMGYARDCSASAMFVSNTVPTFEALRRKLLFRFFDRVKSSSNLLISAVFSSDCFLRSKITSKYMNLMYF